MRKRSRKRRESANYFNKYKEVLEDLFEIGNEGKRLGFTNKLQHAIYELLLQKTSDESFSKKITKKIYDDIKPETEIIGWKTKRDSQRIISSIIYDNLQETNNKKLMEIEDEISNLQKR